MMRGYRVVLASSVVDAMAGITSRDDSCRVRCGLEALRIAPAMGAVYDPVYEAARPPHEVRATYAGHFGTYYTVDDACSTVNVEYLEDVRRDPMGRFTSGEA